MVTVSSCLISNYNTTHSRLVVGNAIPPMLISFMSFGIVRKYNNWLNVVQCVKSVMTISILPTVEICFLGLVDPLAPTKGI